MVRKTRIDFVNDPVKLAVRMLETQQESVMAHLQVGRKPSALRQVAPDHFTLKEFREILGKEPTFNA
jgi:hypothetical protein